MFAEDNINDLIKKFNNKYKISEVCYIPSSKLLCLKILTLLDITNDSELKEVEDSIKNSLNLDILYNFSFCNPCEDFNYFSDLIKAYFKNKLDYEISNDDIKIQFLDDIKITLKVVNAMALKFKVSTNLKSFIEFLEKNTFKKIDINILVKENEMDILNDGYSNTDLFKDREKLLRSNIEEEYVQKNFKIRGLDIVVGKNFTDIATCLNQITCECDFIQVAGKIRYFAERSFKKKSVKDGVEIEEDKIFYTFELIDGFGKIKASYFPTKMFLEKDIKIEDGQIVTICGKIENYKDNLSLKVKEIAFCCLPEGQLKVDENNENRISIDNNNSKNSTVEESDEDMIFKSEPVSYETVFPSKYSEPNQMDIFSSLINKDETCKLLANKDYVVFDLETTGLDYSSNDILEIGAVKIRNGKIIEIFNTLCNPNQKISSFITELTGISEDMVAFAPKFENVVGDFYKFTRNSTLVAHNSDFDTTFLNYHAKKCLYRFDNPVIDTLAMSRRLLPSLKNHKLGTIAKYLDVVLDNAHRALFDTIATANCFIKLCRLDDK